MQFIKFRDTCVITRGTGKDEWDNESNPDIIYDGECLYEEGTSGATRFFTMRNPTVFIPGAEALVQINDAITIETEAGRIVKSIVKIVREVNMDWRSGVKVTRIELKQSQGE